MLSLDFFIANVSAGVLSALCSVCDFTLTQTETNYTVAVQKKKRAIRNGQCGSFSPQSRCNDKLSEFPKL